MDAQEIVRLVEDVPGGVYTVLGSAVVGLAGILLFLCWALTGRDGAGGGSGTSRQTGVPRGRTASATESEGEENGEVRSRKQQPRSKISKMKQQPSNKKITLPPHPLLAAEFKGHTGSVLSLDFDSNGKYLASCSDGMLLLGFPCMSSLVPIVTQIGLFACGI